MLIDEIKEREGYKQIPYRDSKGFWTCGYGHLLEDDLIIDHVDAPNIATVGELLDVIRDPFVHERWLEDDIDIATRDADQLIAELNVDLHPIRREVLIEMAFQLGLTKLRKFRKMLSAISNQRWDDAAAEMLDSKWARDDTPARAIALYRKWKNADRTIADLSDADAS